MMALNSSVDPVQVSGLILDLPTADRCFPDGEEALYVGYGIKVGFVPPIV